MVYLFEMKNKYLYHAKRSHMKKMNSIAINYRSQRDREDDKRYVNWCWICRVWLSMRCIIHITHWHMLQLLYISITNDIQCYQEFTWLITVNIESGDVYLVVVIHTNVQKSIPIAVRFGCTTWLLRMIYLPFHDVPVGIFHIACPTRDSFPWFPYYPVNWG